MLNEENVDGSCKVSRLKCQMIQKCGLKILKSAFEEL